MRGAACSDDSGVTLQVKVEFKGIDHACVNDRPRTTVIALVLVFGICRKKTSVMPLADHDQRDFRRDAECLARIWKLRSTVPASVEAVNAHSV